MTRAALPIDRFLARCRRDPVSGCLVYPTRRDRYPQQWVAGRSVGIHRLALELYLAAKIGLPRPLPLPPRTMVLHGRGCVGKACVLGEHLRAGDGSENLKDAILAGHRPVKLTREAVQQIRAAPRTSQAHRDLAATFEVTTAHVRAVQRGRCWSWIGERVAA